MPFIGALQPMHLLLILAIVLVVFGAGKLSQVGGALGQSVREFKTSVADPEEEKQKALAAETVKVEERPAVTAVPQAPASTVTVIRPTERQAETTLRREEI